MRRALALSLVCVVLLGVAAARADEPVVQVIPPGNEPLVAAMTGSGAALPAKCALDRAAVDHTKVIASYTCDGRAVTLELVSLKSPEASAAAARTAQFAVIAKGDPPKALVDDVVARVTAGEKDWRWASTGGPGVPGDGHDPGGPGGPPQASVIAPRTIGAAVFGAAALSGLVWLFVKRRRRGDGP
jgi:hypothetical protein